MGKGCFCSTANIVNGMADVYFVGVSEKCKRYGMGIFIGVTECYSEVL